MAKSDGGDYFKTISFFMFVAVTFGVGYFSVSSLNCIYVKSNEYKITRSASIYSCTVTEAALCCVYKPSVRV